MRSISFCFLVLAFCIGCKQKKKKEKFDNAHYVSVLSFLQSQVKKLDTSLYSITKVVTVDGKSDSTPLPRDSVRGLAQDFLNIPDLRSEQGKSYKELTNYDSAMTMGSMTYWNEGTEVPKQQVYWVKTGSDFNDVIKTIYIEKEIAKGDSFVAKRLIWDVVEQYFQVRTIVTRPNFPEKVTDLKVLWTDAQSN